MSRSRIHPLRLERKRRNLSQRMLADFTGLSLSTIVRAERGESIGADARQRLCDYLGKTSLDLGLITTDIPVRSADDEPEALPPGHGISVAGDMSRRQAFKHFGIAGMGAVGVMAGVHGLLADEPWERLVRILRSSSSVDDATLAHLRAITTSYWQLRANRTSRELLGGILGHLHTVTDLLDSVGSFTNRRQLISIAGDAALVGGQIAFDLNEHTAARGYYRVALEAAAESETPALQAVALARMSFTSTERGDAEGAVTLVQRAQAVAGHEVSPTVQGWLYAIEAEAHATLGDDRACLAALDQAEHALHGSLGEEDRYWTGFDTSRLAGYRGLSLVRLGQPELAIAALEHALSSLNGSALRRRPRILVELAAARVQQGEIEEACRLAAEALTITEVTHNAMMLPRLERLQKSLAPWRSTAPVRELHEQLLLCLP